MGETPALPRLRPPEAETFRRDFLTGQQPVVITGLFDDQPAAAIRTIDDALRFWGNVPLTISMEYTHNGYQSQWDGASVPDRQMTMAEYVRHAEAEPRTPWLCVEQPTPRQVADCLSPPPYCDLLAEEGDTTLSFFFCGNAGNRSNFHYDGDLRPVLLHQLAGRKRAVLVPPRQSTKMLPMKNFSGWMFYNMSPRDQENFLAFTGGLADILYPGETLFIPTGWWHHLDYVDISLSVNFRLRRNRLLRLLGDGEVHFNYKSQAIAVRFLSPDPDPEAAEVHAAIRQALTAKEDRIAKFRRIEALFDQIYEKLEVPDGGEPVTAGLVPRDEIDYWQRSLTRGKLYAAA